MEIHQTAGDPRTIEVRRSGHIGPRGEPRAISAYPIIVEGKRHLERQQIPSKDKCAIARGTVIVTRRAETPEAARGAKRLEPVSAGAQRRRMPPDVCHESQESLAAIEW